MPNSVWLLKILLFLYFLTSSLVSHVDYPWSVSIVASLTDTALVIVASYSLLSFRGLVQRFIQTATAIMSVGIIMNLLGLPVLMALRAVAPLQNQLTSVVLLALMVLMFWNLFILAHIFRLSLDIRPGSAAMVTVGYILLTIMLVSLAISGVT